MEDTLSEDLHLNIIGGKVIAFFELNEDEAYKDFINESAEFKNDLPEFLRDEIEQGLIPDWFDVEDYVSECCINEVEQYCKRNPAKYYQTNWCLEFKFPGPNARYNDGIANISSESFEKFIDGFKQGL